MSLMNDALRKKNSEMKPLDEGMGRIIIKDARLDATWRRRRFAWLGMGVIAVILASGALYYARFNRMPILPAAVPNAGTGLAAQEGEEEAVAGTDEISDADADPDLNRTQGAVHVVSSSDVNFPVAEMAEQAEKGGAGGGQSEVHAVGVSRDALLTDGGPGKLRAVSDSEKRRNIPLDNEKEPDKAADTVERGKGFSGRVPQAETPDPVALFYQKALLFHGQNRPREAIDMYQAVLKLNPDHPGARFNLAAAFIQAEAFSKAYPLLVALKESQPDNPDVLLNLAISEIGSGRPEAALHLLETAEEKNASAFDIYFHRGVVYSRLQQTAEALRWYRMAEVLNPGHDRLMMNLALSHDKLAQYGQAVRYYQLFMDRADVSFAGEKKAVSDRIRVLKSVIGGNRTETPEEVQ